MNITIKFTIPEVILGKNLMLETIWTTIRNIFILTGISEFSMTREE